MFAKENQGPAQRKATKLQAAIEEDQTSTAEAQDTAEDSRIQQDDDKNLLPAERQKDGACFYSDLLDISNDWTAYESLFCDYFD